jgi:hypothetical protein
MPFSPNSKLFLPATFCAPPDQSGFRNGAESLVPPTYRDVAGAPSSSKDLYEAVAAVEPLETIRSLAALNILLDQKGRDAGVQQLAVERYVRPNFRSVAVDSSQPRPTYAYIMNRIGAMIAFKAVVGVERPCGPSAEMDPYQIGDVILRANQFISGTRFDGVVEPQTDADLAAEAICTWDLTNPRDIGYEVPGVYRMFELLDMPDATVAKLKAKLDIVTAELRIAGLPPLDFIAIVFGLVAFAQSMDPGMLLNNPQTAVFDRNTFLTNVKIPQANLEKFLDGKCISFLGLQQRLTEGTPWTSDQYESSMGQNQFRTDFLPFRERPLLAINEKEFIVPHLQFLTELMFSGLFFDLYFQFPKEKRDTFSQLWGRLFELSLSEMLDYYYPKLSGLLQTDVSYEGGQIDAILDFGSSIIIFEFKHFMLTHEVKYSRSGALLETALREKLFATTNGNPKAIRQLITSATAIRDGRVNTLMGRSNFHPRSATLYPITVIDDPCLEAPFVNLHLNELFQGERRDLDIRPLTLMSVQEFEGILPLIASGQLGWPELLDDRFDGNAVRPTSINQARYNLSRSKGLTYCRNQFRLDQFAELFASLEQVYLGGERPAPAPPTRSSGVGTLSDFRQHQ